MNRVLLIAAFLFSLCVPASSQFNGCPAGFCAPVSSGGVSYQGPGDIVSGAIAFYSCRAYKAASTGTKAYRVQRASDSTQADVSSLPTGLCDTATPAAFCASTTCLIVEWYDQSGANACGSAPCHMTPNTVSTNSPNWSSSSLNGWPCAGGVMAAALQNVTGITQALPFTVTAVGERTGNFTAAARVFSSNAANANFGWRTSANTVGVVSGLITATASDSAFHALISVQNTSSSVSAIVVDGTATTGTVTLSALSSSIYFLSDNDAGFNNLEAGEMCEAGIWPIAFTSTQYGNMNTNMHSATYGWNF